MAHIIRLREAWNVDHRELPDGSRSATFTRNFGCSSGLKSASRVWLSIEDVVSRASLALNGTPLGQIFHSRSTDEPAGQRCPAKFEITTLLQPRNVLTIEILSPNEATETNQPDSLGLVQLEIE